jgi:phosphatidylglycerol phospholipase C
LLPEEDEYCIDGFIFRFRMECKAAGKKLLVWTVNEPDHMMEVRILYYFVSAAIDSKNQAVRWGVDAILTDFTKTWLDMRTALYCTYYPSITNKS